jgi:putative nucleotidyltransferase with HDIG domain
VGEKWLLHLIVAAGLEGFLSQPEEGYSLCKGGLFQHACGTARVAGSLAQLTGQAPLDLAYTAGLLHDIGKVVLDQYMGAARPLFYRCVQAADVDLIRAERELFGVTHPEVGSRLAARWSIPATLADAIQHHHQPEQAAIAPELTHLVYLADLIMSRFRVGQELEKLNTDRFASRLGRIGLAMEQFPILIEKISHEIADFPWPGSSK